MTLKAYAKRLNALAKLHPDAIVVSASDEEGNSYSEVIYSPTLGHWDKVVCEWSTDHGSLTPEKVKVNAVCVN